MKDEIGRIPLYINGLDKEIEGGVPKGFVNLISGVAGSMKSSIVFNILFNEALKGKNSFYISIEQSYESFSRHLSNMGLDISKVNIALVNVGSSKLNYVNKAKKGLGTIMFLDVPSIREKIINTKKFGEVLTVQAIMKMIDKFLKSLKYEYFVLDSLNALSAIADIKRPRETLFGLFDFLRFKGLTSYLTLEVSVGKKSYGEYGIEDYISDSVIFVDSARYDRIVQREVSIKKMRATKTNINIFTLAFEKGQFKATAGGKIPVLDFDSQ